MNNPEKLAPDELVDYIIVNFHNRTKEILPLIEKNLEKISSTHAKKHPELSEALKFFIKLNEQLLQHMNKEEKVLFPYIKELTEAIKNRAGKPASSCFTTVNKPIAIMEKGHEIALEIFDEIKELLDDYEVPEDACITYKVTLKELESLEEDLQQNLYLENEILFPKVKGLEKVFV